MMPSPRSAAGLLACVLSLALFAPAAAQDPDEARRFCATGRPEPVCATFLVATLNYFPGDRGEGESWNLVEWDVGVMTNLGPAHAVGTSIALGTSNTGFHISAKGRYRRWLGHGFALDAGAGIMIAQHPPRTYPHETIAGPTADVSLGLTDWAALTARGHVLWGGSAGGTNSELDLGVRLGTVPGIVATIVGGAAMIAGTVGAS